jgi:hypothetical protein
LSKLNTPLDIYKFLPKSNCGQCQLAGCLAFAAAVIKGQKNLNECTNLDDHTIRQLNKQIVNLKTADTIQEQLLKSLQREISSVDFPSSALRLGASYTGKYLKIKVLGKDFMVDSNGIIISDCHVNYWVTIPLLSYIKYARGSNAAGNWVPFRELKNGKSREAIFRKRCEQALKHIIDKNTDLLEDIISVFSGSQLVNVFSSDISLVLYPLPKIPILINYYKPIDDLESKLNIFLDETAEDNLNIELIHMLCTGLVTMFERIAVRHS